MARGLLLAGILLLAAGCTNAPEHPAGNGATSSDGPQEATVARLVGFQNASPDNVTADLENGSATLFFVAAPPGNGTLNQTFPCQPGRVWLDWLSQTHPGKRGQTTFTEGLPCGTWTLLIRPQGTSLNVTLTAA